MGGRFLNLVCQGAVRTPAPPSVTPLQGRKCDEICRVHIWICNESRKRGRVVMRKVAISRKRKTHNRQWKTRSISICECLSVWLWCWRCYIFSKNETCSFILNSCRIIKFEGWRGRHYYGRPLAALSHSTPLGIFNVRNRRKKYIYILFISKYLYMSYCFGAALYIY